MSGQILLNGILEKARTNYPAGLDDDAIFERYCVENILVNYDLDYTELESGLVDGSKDAGVDGAYVFVDRNLVRDDFDFENVKQPTEIELYIIQAKNQDTFKEGPIDKLSSSLPLLLDQERKDETLEALFKPEVVRTVRSFIRAMERLADRFPSVAIHIFYCSKGTEPNAVTAEKARGLEATLNAKYKNASIAFLGAQQLYERSSTQKRLIKTIPTSATPISGNNSYVALCKLTDYAKFLSDENGELINRIFEANVRAYQGEVEVNKEIAASLGAPTAEVDFWWLNNGVTIVADQANYVNNRLVIENPLIVNGLQTSHVIHNYAKNPAPDDQRMVLLRIITETEGTKRDQIIRATNRQTGLKHSSFRATESVHRQIEDYLATLGYYYDRRKNFYKRQGKPADKILTIDRLAQGVITLLSQAPHTARARPTTAIKNDNDYKKIFSDNSDTHPLKMYGKIAQMLEAVELYLRKIATTENQIFRNNLKFHILMVLGWALNQNKNLPAQRIAQLNMSGMTEPQIKSVADWVFKQFKLKGAEDRVAKDGEFTKHLMNTWDVNATTP